MFQRTYNASSLAHALCKSHSLRFDPAYRGALEVVRRQGYLDDVPPQGYALHPLHIAEAIYGASLTGAPGGALIQRGNVAYAASIFADQGGAAKLASLLEDHAELARHVVIFDTTGNSLFLRAEGGLYGAAPRAVTSFYAGCPPYGQSFALDGAELAQAFAR